MQTAEEFEHSLHRIFWREPYADGEGQRRLIVAIQARDRDVRLDERRQALVDAAKAECEMCKEGDVPESHGKHWYHLFDEETLECEVQGIQNLIAKLDAEVNDGEST